MVNNYVKLKLIPKPVKKRRYNKVHLSIFNCHFYFKTSCDYRGSTRWYNFQARINGKKMAHIIYFAKNKKRLLSTL